MSTGPADHRSDLYALLPSVHRQRDGERGQPLRALLDILADEGGRMEDDILALLDGWFIETCEEWAVPYIGALLRVRGLQETDGASFSRRALVANTLAYRRRKGVAGVLEQLAWDAAGWRGVAREMFLQLAGTQHVNHLRPAALRTPDLRDSAAFDPPQQAFGTAAHMVDVRSVARGRGRFNIPNVALHLWRLQAYWLARAEPRPAGPPGAWLASPAGIDAPLFNPPHSNPGAATRSRIRDLPIPLRRRPLHDELEARRRALAEGRTAPAVWFDDGPGAAGPPVFAVHLDGVPVPPERLMICDLSDWRAPPDSRDYPVTAPDGSATVVTLPIDAAIDPELGRLILAPARTGAQVRLTASHGFSGDLGAGPYSRRAHLEPRLATRPVTWTAGVAAEPQSPGAGIFPTLAAALAAWDAEPPGSVGVIALMDSARHAGGLTGAAAIRIPEGSQLFILAADWPAVQDPGAPPGVLRRPQGRIAAEGVRPVILGDIEVVGTAPADSDTPGALHLDGLLLDGSLRVDDGHLGELALSHVTILPAAGGLDIAAGNPALTLRLHRTISGGVAAGVPLVRLVVSDSIVDAAPLAIDAAETAVEICDSTLLGGARVRALEASGTTFMGAAEALRRQTGCVRYCYLPEGSQTPRRFRCQPDLALDGAPAAQAAAIRARLRPTFTALTQGAPGYGQLGRRCAEEIALGGEDGDEMGAFRFLRQPQRLANLRTTLPDYLPFGLEIGTFVET